MRVQTLSWMGMGLAVYLGQASAATLIGTTLNPIGFTGLIINGVSYDVTFSTNSYDALFTGAAPPPIFAANPENAFLAERPLNDALRAAGVTGLGGVPCASRQENCLIFIPTTPFTSTFGQVTSNGAGAIWTVSQWGNLAGDPGLLLTAPGGDAVCFPNGCDYFFEYAVLRLTPTSPPVSHSVKYNVAVLDKLSGGTFTQATAINNSGVVVGSGDELLSIAGASPTPVTSAILWTGNAPTAIVHGDPNGVMNQSSPVASAINDSNAVVGSLNIRIGPFYWNAGSESPLPIFTDLALANGINDAGKIVGTSGPIAGQQLAATVWASAGAAPVVLPALAEFGGGPNVASGINASGSIVGTSSNGATSRSISHATLWSGSSVTDLGTLGGSSSAAAAINSLGHIVGWADIGNNTEHAALWEPTTRAFDLGTLGGKASYASGVNVEGDVVGSAQTSYGVWHAVLWTHKHFAAVDLNAEIGVAESQSITLTAAVGTNDHCAIVANGYNNKTKAAGSYVLTLADQSNCNE